MNFIHRKLLNLRYEASSFNIVFWFWLPLATKAPCSCPSPCHGAEENGKKKRQKPVGQDKGSLTEQQTKETGTTMIR